MDQPNPRARQESSAESILLSAADCAREEDSPCADQFPPAADQETGDIISAVREGRGEAVHDKTTTEDPTRSLGDAAQCNSLHVEDARERLDVPLDNVLRDPGQLPSFVSPEKDLNRHVQDCQMSIHPEVICARNCDQGALASANGLQEVAFSCCLHKSGQLAMDEGVDEHTSLEMLSVAVESLENMKRQSEEASKNNCNKDLSPATQKLRSEGDSEDVLAEFEKDHVNKLSTRESGDNESSVSYDHSAPSADSKGKEHVLNMLCELAAFHQHEPEPSNISEQVASCMESFSHNVTACDETRSLNLADLLGKETGHSESLSGLETDGAPEEHLKRNEDVFRPQTAKDWNVLMPSTAMAAKQDAVVVMGSNQTSNGILNREGDKPSTNDILGFLKPEEVKDGGFIEENVQDSEKRFEVGDLVWAKVKSHPWWPGQIFDASDASLAAKRIQKPGRMLVAFYGDGTFGWLQQSQLIPFLTNFNEKAKQTTMKSFCRAVVEALDEVSRCMELGLKCSHAGNVLYSPNVFPDLNVGIRKGVRQYSCHRNLDTRKELLQPERMVAFVRSAACSPLYPLSSGLEYSKLCGQFYGFRSFMLSPKRPKSKTTPLNTAKVKAEKKRKPMQTPMVKRKVRVDESVDDLCLADGKDLKRLCLSKDGGGEVISIGGTVLSPNIKSVETISLTETEESKVCGHESKFCEQVQRNFSLAEGKCQRGSPDGKEKKRVRSWQSSGSFKGAQSSETRGYISASSDDDNRTLLDITGYHSLKRKKKDIRESTADMPTKEVDQKLVEIKQGFLEKHGTECLNEVREKDLDFPDYGGSSLSIAVSQPCPLLPPSKEDCIGVEEGRTDNRYSVIFKSSNRQGEVAVIGLEDTHIINHGANFCGNKKDQCDLKDAVVLAREEMKEEGVDGITNIRDAEDGDDCAEEALVLKNANALSTEQASAALEVVYDGKLLALNGNTEEENLKVEMGPSNEFREEPKKGREMLAPSIVEKNEADCLNTGDIHQGEKPEEQLRGSSAVRRRMKRVHSDMGKTFKSSMRKGKKVQHMPNKSNRPLRPLLKEEQLKSFKASETSASPRKVAGALEGMSVNLKTAHSITSEDRLFADCVECEVSKGTKKLNSGSCLLKKHVPAQRSGANDENLNIFLPKLLCRLQDVAKDPLSSANMKNCLGGVMSAFLKFRNMVFIKSSGYAAGKLVPPTMKDHLSSDKKGSDQAHCSKRSYASGMQQIGEQDSSGKAKAVATKKCLFQIATSGGQESHMGKVMADNKTASTDKSVQGLGTSACNETPCTHDPSAAACKRHCEVSPVSASKDLRESEALKRSAEKLAKEKDAVMRHHGKREKHHVSRSEGLSILEKRSSVKSFASAKVALGLFMQFQKDYTLPTETELREVFNKFGSLEKFGIRVYRNDSTAQVVFKCRDDAEAAWQHARKNRMFGQANVSYRLRYFSLSSKNDSKPHSLASGQKGSMEIKQSAQNLRRTLLARHPSAVPQKGPSLPSKFSTEELSSDKACKDKGYEHAHEQPLADGAIACSCENVREVSSVRDSLVSKAVPGAFKVVEQAPVHVVVPSKSEMVHTQSPVWDSLEGKSVLGAISTAEPAPVQMGSIDVLEGYLGNAPAGILQLTLPASSGLGISLSSGPDLGDSVVPSVTHQLEALQSSGQPDVSIADAVNSLSVSSRNVSPGDIQDEMMKLLQQVSVIVSSTAFTHRSS